MLRRTKIICTLGPAGDSEDMIRALIRTGMNAARFNFSHGSHEDFAKKIAEDKITVMVTPCLVKNSSMLSGVSDVFNACLGRGDMTGDVLMYGKGAGKLATASAVVGDVIDCAANDKERKFFGWADEKKDFVASYLENETAFYVRATDADKAEIEKVFGPVQYLQRANQADNEIAFVTSVMKESDFNTKLSELKINLITVIRISDY